MIAHDEEALICDFAETYHIYDYRGLRPKTAAVLACGLGPDSRTKRLLTGQKVSMDTLLLAAIADRLSLLLWAQSRDARHGANRPASIVDVLNRDPEEKEQVAAFATPDDFEAARKRIFEG